MADEEITDADFTKAALKELGEPAAEPVQPSPAAPATPAPADPVAEPTPSPAEPIPAPEPAKPAPANFDKGLMQAQQRLAAQEREMAEMKATIAKLSTPAPAPEPAPVEEDELEQLAKIIGDDEQYDTAIHGRKALQKLIDSGRATKKQLAEISALAQKAQNRADEADRKLQASEQARAQDEYAKNYWRAFSEAPETSHIKDAPKKFAEYVEKYAAMNVPDPAAAAAIPFNEWVAAQPKPAPAAPAPAKPSATPAAAKPAAAKPAIAPPDRATSPGSIPIAEEETGEFTPDQIAALARELS